MPSLLNNFPEANLAKMTYGVWSDFHEFVSGDDFTALAGDVGASATRTDAAGGSLVLTTGATDNNEAYVWSTSESFLFANNKPIWARCRLNINEANTNDAAVIFGLMNAWAANQIVDAGATVLASYSGALFFKRKDTLTWRVEASIGATRTGEVVLSSTTALDKADHPTGDVVNQWLDIECIPFSSTQQKINFYIDEVLVYSLDHTYTSATEMAVGAGVKAGGANSEIVTVDFLGAWQKR